MSVSVLKIVCHGILLLIWYQKGPSCHKEPVVWSDTQDVTRSMLLRKYCDSQKLLLLL